MKKFLFLLLFVSCFFLLFGCTEDEKKIVIPANISNFTDLNSYLVRTGFYDGNCLFFDGNTLTAGSCAGDGNNYFYYSFDGNVYSLGLIDSSNAWQIDINTSGVLKSDLNVICTDSICFNINDLNELGTSSFNGYVPTESDIDNNALEVINNLDLNESLDYLKSYSDTNCEEIGSCPNVLYQADANTWFIKQVDGNYWYVLQTDGNAWYELKTDLNADINALINPRNYLTNYTDTNFETAGYTAEAVLLDTNASTACDVNEVLMGDGICLNLNDEAEASLVETVNRNIYVDADVSGGDGDGSSWANAFGYDNTSTPLQTAIDSIKQIIASGVTITVYVRGEFNDGANEDVTMKIKKVCLGTGQIIITADDYLQDTLATGSTNNTVSFSGTYDNNYWQNSYVWIWDNAATGARQARKIIDSVSSGGTTTLTVESNWGTNPAASDKLVVAGRARITQGSQWIGITADGGNTTVVIKGFALHGFTDGEGYGLGATYGAQVTLWDCIGYGNTGGENNDFQAYFNGSVRAFWCASVNSGGTGFVSGSYAYMYLGRPLILNPGRQSLFVSSGTVDTYYFSSVGGTESIQTEYNSFVNVTDNFGSDGSNYGIISRYGSQVRTTGTTTLSETADAASYGYIQ